ncbi:hypothetical protein ABK040_002532 [Willaertia magna]
MESPPLGIPTSKKKRKFISSTTLSEEEENKVQDKEEEELEDEVLFKIRYTKPIKPRIEPLLSTTILESGEYKSKDEEEEPRLDFKVKEQVLTKETEEAEEDVGLQWEMFEFEKQRIEAVSEEQSRRTLKTDLTNFIDPYSNCFEDEEEIPLNNSSKTKRRKESSDIPQNVISFEDLLYFENTK